MHNISEAKMTTISKPGLKWLWLIFILFILDQASKWWVLAHVKTGEFVQLIPSFNLTMAHNSGIAFSLFSQKSSWGQVALILFIILICSFIAGMLLNTKLQEKWNGISLSLILGGALGNLCDRIWHGYVIDFIDFYVNNWHWYTFNLADAFITVGAIMMTKTILFPKE